MTRSILLFFFFLIIQKTTAQNNGPQLTLKSLYLKGKVRSVTTIVSAYLKNMEGRTKLDDLRAYKTVFYKTGYIDSSFTRMDSNKFVMDYHYFWRNDTLISTVHKKQTWSKDVFNKDQLPVYSYFYSPDSRRPESQRWFAYDKEGKLLELKTDYDWHLNNTYKKNADNTFNVVNNKLDEGEYYIINPQLKKTFELNLFSTGSKIEKKYDYDGTGNVIRESEKYYKKENTGWVLYSTKQTSYKYKYDAQKNWTEKASFIKEEPSNTEQPYQVERRIIQYW